MGGVALLMTGAQGLPVVSCSLGARGAARELRAPRRGGGGGGGGPRV